MTDDTSTDDGVLLAFYADDFTGATDSLEGLADNGARAMLFLESPTPADLERFDEIDAIGIAGNSRTLSPAEMDDELPSTFKALRNLDTPVVHYKVCSTFDSSPTVGSIGKAIDIAHSIFASSFVPVSQGTEVPLGRYVAFSNLYAVADGEPYRIDRHPVMKNHPVTPMHESDLRRHLAAQTDREISRITLDDLATPETAATALDEDHDLDGEIIVLDAVSVTELETIGELLWDRAREETGPLFTVGSSGLEHHALVHAWDESGRIDREERLYRKRTPVEQLLVMSGSASPTTAAQIDWALENDFQPVRLDTEALIDPDAGAVARQQAIDAASDALTAGDDVLIYAARGPDDPAIAQTRARYEKLEIEESLETRLGRQQGIILRDLIERAEIDRACVAGGDTSTHSISSLDIHALEAIAPVAPGAPLCRIHADEALFDGLEIALKGGQIESRNDAADYFGLVKDGGISAE